MRRVLAFLLLAGLGVFLLWQTVANEPAAQIRTGGAGVGSDEPSPPSPRPVLPQGGPGVPLQDGKLTASVSQTGAIEMPITKPIKQADGSVRNERVMLLKAEQSQPVESGLQQLDGVTATIHEHGKHAATLTATRAFVQFGKNANGTPTIDAAKDIDLRDAVLVTLPDSRLSGLRLDLGNATVRVLDSAITLRTLPEQHVELTLAGERPLQLVGLGALANLPRDANGGEASIELLRDPVFTGDGVTVRSKGRLHYRERPDSGAARLSLVDDVRLDLERAVLPMQGTMRNTVAVRGDQFVAWLVRSEVDDSGRRQSVWTTLELTGAPTRVELGDDTLRTPRLTALPGPFGEPFLLTAHGDSTRVEHVRPARPGRGEERLTAGSGERMHFLRPGEQLGALHRGLGFPRWTLSALNERQVVLVEGASELRSATRTVTASHGAHVFRSEHQDAGIVIGRGTVHVESPSRDGKTTNIADGSDGCWLRDDGTTERLRLGPPAPRELADAAPAWRAHRYEVKQGDTVLRGRGSCELERRGDDLDVHLLAPAADVLAALPSEGLSLAGVRELRATVRADELRTLDVAGWPVQVAMRDAGRSVQATAPRLVLAGPRSLRLLPIPADARPGLYPELAEAVRKPWLASQDTEGSAELRGPCIDVHHVGGRAAYIEAITVADEHPTLHARTRRPRATEDTTIACTADRLRLLPFALPNRASKLVGGVVGATLATLTQYSVGQPWLLVDELRDLQFDDRGDGHVEGSAHRLLLARGAEAALFEGDGDRLSPAVVRRRMGERTVELRGARVRVFRDDALRLHALGTYGDRPAFLAPWIELHEPGRAGPMSHLRAVCRGNIEVRPEAVVFLGPVLADSLTPDGEVLADGMHFDARDLQLLRLSNGDIARAVALDAELTWSRVSARAAKLELDLPRHLAIVDDPKGAIVRVPGLGEWVSPHIEVDHETLVVRTHRGRGTRAPAPSTTETGR